MVGFHQDQQADWVAELSCGHGQHVRHQPPFTLRPWVTTPEGRGSRLGQPLDCVRCDRLELPEDFVSYRTTPTFTADTVPPGLLSEHTTKPGVWGKLEVQSGALAFVFTGESERRRIIGAGEHTFIPPEAKHRVEVIGPVVFALSFYRAPFSVMPPPSP